MTLGVVVDDVLEEISVDLEHFDVVGVDFVETAEVVGGLLDGVGDFGAQHLELVDVRVVLEELAPEVEVEVDGLFDDALEVDELVLEVDDDVDVDALGLGVPRVVVDHFFLDEVFVAVDGEFLLHVGLVFLGDHHFEKGLELVVELLSLDVGVQHVESRALLELLERVDHDFLDPHVPKFFVGFFFLDLKLAGLTGKITEFLGQVVGGGLAFLPVAVLDVKFEQTFEGDSVVGLV